VSQASGLGCVEPDGVGRSGVARGSLNKADSAEKFAALAGVKYQTLLAAATTRTKSGGQISQVPAAAADKVPWQEAVVEQAQSPAGSQLPPRRNDLAATGLSTRRRLSTTHGLR
jgi:hypothetical protein